MANNLGRLFSSIHNISAPKLAIASPFRSNSAIRLVSSSAEQHQHNQQDLGKEQAEAAGETLRNDNEETQGEEGDEDQGDGVNKETGEIGGPRGPEPTRYGDWERNGRCCDF